MIILINIIIFDYTTSDLLSPYLSEFQEHIFYFLGKIRGRVGSRLFAGSGQSRGSEGLGSWEITAEPLK
jgi:hypothetical protein